MKKSKTIKAPPVESKVVQATPDTREKVAELTKKWPTGPTYDDILKNVESAPKAGSVLGFASEAVDAPKGGTGVTFGPKIVPKKKPSMWFFHDEEKKARRLVWTKLFATYLVGIIGLIVAYRTGFLQEVVKAAGWVTYAVAGLVIAHIATAFVALRRSGGETVDFSKAVVTLHPRAGNLVDWLAKIDATILTVGFLGKLYAIAVVVGAAGAATDPTSIAAGIAAINGGIAQALFSTMAGLAVAAWTHCATLVVSHKG